MTSINSSLIDIHRHSPERPEYNETYINIDHDTHSTLRDDLEPDFTGKHLSSQNKACQNLLRP